MWHTLESSSALARYVALEQMAFWQDKNMVLRIYASVTRVFFSCVFALPVGEAIKLC